MPVTLTLSRRSAIAVRHHLPKAVAPAGIDKVVVSSTLTREIAALRASLRRSVARGAHSTSRKGAAVTRKPCQGTRWLQTPGNHSLLRPRWREILRRWRLKSSRDPGFDVPPACWWASWWRRPPWEWPAGPPRGPRRLRPITGVRVIHGIRAGVTSTTGIGITATIGNVRGARTLRLVGDPGVRRRGGRPRGHRSRHGRLEPS